MLPSDCSFPSKDGVALLIYLFIAVMLGIKRGPQARWARALPLSYSTARTVILNNPSSERPL